MDAGRFDHLTKHVSRRGLAFGIGAALLSIPDASDAKGSSFCGGEPTSLTTFCRTGGACESDVDCSESCACIERRVGCCGKVRGKKGKGKRRCIDGAPGKYCTPRV